MLYTAVVLRSGSTMASVIDHIIKEVRSVRELLAARAAAGGEPTKLQKQFGDAIIKQLSTLKTIQLDDAQPLLTELQDNPYGKHITNKVLDAIDSKLQSPSAAPSNKVGVGGQFLKEVWNFQTQEDWEFYRHPKKFFAAKMTRMVERMHSIGITTPHEQTFKWMLAVLLACHYDELPRAKMIFDKLNELKQITVAEKKPYPFDKITTYPSTPSELHAHAYTGQQPISVTLSGIHSIADRIPLRKSSNLLKNDTASGMKHECFKEEPSPMSVPSVKLQAVKNEHDSSITLQPVGAHPSQVPCAPQMPPDSSTILVVAPIDPHEESLLATYKGDVWRHRAQLHGVLAQAPSPPPVAKPALYAATDRDGSLMLKSFVPTETKAEPVSEVKPEAAASSADDEGLDDYAKAALNAFSSRSSKKKEELKTKRKAASAAAKSLAMKKTKKTMVKVKKSLHKAAIKKAPKAEVKSESKAVKSESKADYKMLTSASALDSCPTGRSLPLLYKTGIIYTVVDQRKFRALKTRGDKNSESCCSWGKLKSKETAWAKAIKAIDDHAA